MFHMSPMSWNYLFFVTLLVPVCMIGAGLFLWFNPPKTINSIYGYRTKRSRYSQEAWDYAQRFSGRLCFFLGLLTLGITVAAMLNSRELAEVEMTGNALSVVLAQLTPFAGVYLATERAIVRKITSERSKQK